MDARHRTLSDVLRETHVAPALVDRLACTVFNMGARFPSVFSTSFLAAPPAAGTETVLVTTPPLTLPFDSATVFILWYCGVVVGTGTTTGRALIRRGTSSAGPNINPNVNINVTAGNTVAFSGCCADSTPGASQPQYSLTLSGIGTTGAWTGVDQWILAFAL